MNINADLIVNENAIIEKIQRKAEREMQKNIQAFCDQYIASIQQAIEDDIKAEAETLLEPERLNKTCKTMIRSYMHEQIEYAVRADVHRYPRFNWNAIAKWGNGDDGEALFTAVTSFCAYQDIIKDEKIQEAVKESAASQIATEICKKLRNKNIYAKVCEFLVDQMGKEETNG